MMKYEERLILPENGFDECGNLLPQEVLLLFETLAGHHAEELGVGFAAMLERNLLWVIRNIKYEVCGKLVPGTEVTGITWPLPQTKVGFVREYQICDMAGNILIKGTSNWAMIHADSRQLAVAAEVYPKGEYCTERNFEERTRRIRDFEAEEGEALVLRPGEDSIDVNGHVNNTRYAEFACLALGSFTGKIVAFQIDYLREVLCGEELRIFTAKEEQREMAKGLSSNDEQTFICSVMLK